MEGSNQGLDLVKDLLSVKGSVPQDYFLDSGIYLVYIYCTIHFKKFILIIFLLLSIVLGL